MNEKKVTAFGADSNFTFSKQNSLFIPTNDIKEDDSDSADNSNSPHIKLKEEEVK